MYFLLKSYLKGDKKFPNGEGIKSFMCVLYPDGVKRMINDLQFSSTILSQYSEEELRKASSWMQAQVITLLASADPEILAHDLEVLKALNGLVVTPPITENPKSESFRVHVKVLDPLLLPGNEIPAFKAFAQKAIRDGIAGRSDSVSTPQSTPKRTYEIVGFRNFHASDPSVSSSSSVNEAIVNGDCGENEASSSSSSSSSSMMPSKKSKK